MLNFLLMLNTLFSMDLNIYQVCKPEDTRLMCEETLESYCIAITKDQNAVLENIKIIEGYTSYYAVGTCKNINNEALLIETLYLYSPITDPNPNFDICTGIKNYSSKDAFIDSIFGKFLFFYLSSDPYLFVECSKQIESKKRDFESFDNKAIPYIEDETKRF